MKERIVRFGSDRLIGVLTEPDEYPKSSVPLVLIPNTGMEHRVGPNRLHVQLCRALAEAGFPALRVDLSGMGDSALAATPGNTSTDDLRQVMDKLQEDGYCGRFAVIGLCSGGNDAHLLARADQRVVAMASVDAYAYPTLRFKLIYWLQRLLDPSRVWRSLKQKLFPRPVDDVDKAGFAAERVQFFMQPAREEMARDLDQLMARKVRLFYLHTGQVQHEYNYPTQLLDAFPHLRGYEFLSLRYKAQADHTFSRTAMRRELVHELTDWLKPVSTARIGEGAEASRGPSESGTLLRAGT